MYPGSIQKWFRRRSNHSIMLRCWGLEESTYWVKISPRHTLYGSRISAVITCWRCGPVIIISLKHMPHFVQSVQFFRGNRFCPASNSNHTYALLTSFHIRLLQHFQMWDFLEQKLKRQHWCFIKTCIIEYNFLKAGGPTLWSIKQRMTYVVFLVIRNVVVKKVI